MSDGFADSVVPEQRETAAVRGNSLMINSIDFFPYNEEFFHIFPSSRFPRFIVSLNPELFMRRKRADKRGKRSKVRSKYEQKLSHPCIQMTETDVIPQTRFTFIIAASSLYEFIKMGEMIQEQSDRLFDHLIQGLIRDRVAWDCRHLRGSSSRSSLHSSGGHLEPTRGFRANSPAD